MCIQNQRVKRLLRLIPLVSALLLAHSQGLQPRAAQADAVPARFYRPAGDDGYFELLTPPASSKAFELPAPGLDNTCQLGDVHAARWSADGSYLVAEVHNRNGVSLCLYELTLFQPERRDSRTVRTLRASSSGLVEGRNTSGTRQSRQSWSEREPTWARSANSPARLAFVRDDALTQDRVYGIRNLAPGVETAQDSAGSVNFDPGTERKPYQTTMPAWSIFPPVPMGVPPLAVVSNREQTCGQASIQLIEPGAGTGYRHRPLTDPCEGLTAAERQSGLNAADRYPAWNPVRPEGLLAFVRVMGGSRYSLCQVRGVFQPTPRTVCLESTQPDVRARVRVWPTWDDQGRFLAVYAVQGTEQETSAARNFIEIYDQQSASPNPVMQVEDVVRSERQGPSLFSVKGETSLYYISDLKDEAILGKVRRRPLSPPGSEVLLKTGLQGVKVIVPVRSPRGDWAVVVAKGYQDVKNADVSRDRLFLFRLSDL